MEEGSSAEFPGFQTCVHKDDFVYRSSLSRLQRRAPSPLQLIKPSTVPSACNGLPKTFVGSSSSSSSSSSMNPFYYSKDPIPLLSPLVLPSLLESAYVQEGNITKSH